MEIRYLPRLAERHTHLSQEQLTESSNLSSRTRIHVKRKRKPRICSSQLQGRRKLDDLCILINAEIPELAYGFALRAKV